MTEFYAEYSPTRWCRSRPTVEHDWTLGRADDRSVTRCKSSATTSLSCQAARGGIRREA